MADVIETVGLTKRFGKLVAVDRLDLVVREGECYAYLGRNGAGKSTTARMLLDFIRPTSGKARVLGGEGRDPRVRARIGYLPGDLDLARAMKAKDAIAYYGSLRGGVEKSDVDALLDRFALDPSRPVHELSTGNRRKVGLVLAFMSKPELLILDEPTSGLDPVLQEEFRDLLAERKQDGATIWLTSHVMSEVERVADRVGLIDKGRLSEQLTMEDLRRQAAGQIRFSFEDAPSPDALDNVPGVTDVGVEGADMVVTVDGSTAPLLKRAGELGAVSVHTTQRDLDDIFLELYQRGSK